MPENIDMKQRKEQAERPAVKGRKARQGAKKRAERAAQAASIPGAAPLRPDSSATAMVSGFWLHMLAEYCKAPVDRGFCMCIGASASSPPPFVQILNIKCSDDHNL